MTAEEGHILDRRHRALYKKIGVVAGVVLMAAAVTVVLRNGAITDGLVRAIQSPNWDALGYLVLSVLLMQLLTSATFHKLMCQYGRVGFVEMNALLAASTLGNYIPMQAGSLGRVAYHQAVNGIPVRNSLLVILRAMLSMFIALCVLGACALFVHAMKAPWWISLLVPLIWLPLAGDPRLRVFGIVLALRTTELLVWALHAWSEFKLFGWPVSGETALGIALVGSAANLVPFVGNGMGVREWAVALAAPIITGYESTAGLAAELMGRAVDVAVSVPLGLAGFSYLVRRARAASLRVPSNPPE
jgi:hypothetical protein